jgi:hypothetical protein
MSTKAKNSTDVNLKNLTMHCSSGLHDLRPYFQELSIYENIYRPAITGALVLADSHNLPYKAPIVGEETIDIDITLPGFGDGKDSDKYSVNPPPMHVNSLSARNVLKPKAHRFTLDLISETYMSNIHSRVSKSYDNVTISDIVSDIYHTYLYDKNKQGLIYETTDRTERIIIPNMTPMKAIEWLSHRAVPDELNGVNYVYYETVRGSFFVSLDSLSASDPIFTFKQIPRVQDSDGVESISAGIFKIQKYTFLNQFDKRKNTQRGVYSSKLITHDIVRKKILQHEYRGFNEWFGLNHCGTYPPISNSPVDTKSSSVKRVSHAPPDEENSYNTIDERELDRQIDSKIDFYPKHTQMYAKNINDKYDNNVENWKLERSGHSSAYDGICVLVEVSGNTALRIGMTVTLILPSPETTDKDKKSDVEEDKFLSGKYMVTAIQHIFEQGDNAKISYTMKVELTKDGLEEFVPVRKTRKEEEIDIFRRATRRKA